ncbi:hypothetical protein C492_17223 [Natronococcus jeotgali DSM 18795]|uniref:Uncharacterized protein n=1 Tax=Natronococcus jeotgali DSM 18795 TaxID=1227498 RepID=L9WWZ2_9EURY|nr:hypothetical protein C492_17223 [Natronococcus jeotgali DSM 18795]
MSRRAGFPIRFVLAATEVSRTSEPSFDAVDSRSNPSELPLGALTAVTRYDLALGLIPLAFAGSAIASAATEPGLEQSLVPAALVGILAIVDACSLNPPIDADDS